MQTKQTVVGEVHVITLENEFLKAEIVSYGASLFHLYVKTEQGIKEVSVQPNDLDEFLTSEFYYGKTVGRTAGRLFGPMYSIDQTDFYLPVQTYLHGGPEGFSFKHFDVIEITDTFIKLRAISYEDEGPYDGVLTLDVIYEITGKSLIMKHFATTTAPTLCNITNHVYLNLSQAPTIYDHTIKIDAPKYLDINENNEVLNISKVDDTPYDFRREIQFSEQLKAVLNTPFNGYDHTFIFDNKEMNVKANGIEMTLTTSYPSIVLYTHNKPAPHALMHQKPLDNKHIAFTIECQFEPGGVQVSGLNDAILRPNQSYEHHITLSFDFK